jgi:succinoglycan biosynthesis transport protein ExoP
MDDGRLDNSENAGGSRRLATVAPSTSLQRPGYGPVGYPQQDYMSPGYGQESEPDLAATIYYYLRIVIRRKWLIASIALLSLTVGGLYGFMKTPLYSATVRIQIEQKAAKILEGGETSPLGGGRGFLRTQYELLKSRALAERVVSTLGLQANNSFLAPRNASAASIIRNTLRGTGQNRRIVSPLALQSMAVGIVRGGVAIRPLPGSRLVDILYKDPSPNQAARIANAYANAFVAANLDKRFQANAYAKTFLEDQIQQLKIRLEQSEKVLLDFAQREQIVAVKDKASIAENNLSAASVSLGALISERIKNEQLWRQVQNSKGFGLPQLLSNSVIDGLRGRRNTLTTEYQEKRETFKPSYPAMVQISNKIKEIDRQLASEVTTIRQSLKAAYESSKNQETEMRTRISDLRLAVLDLQKRGVQHNIHRREVETNRKLYNSLLQRLKEVDIASGVGTNNVFIVDKAERPGSPSEPRISRILLLSLMLGLGSGLGLAYLLEIMDDRARVPEDVEEATGLSMLGIIPAVPGDDAFQQELLDPRSAVSEAYRSLATALQFSSESGLPRSIAFTSAVAGEGKSTSAIAIARHFALMGMRVLLVDADLRKPSLHTKLSRDNSVGLSNYLTGALPPPETFQDSGYHNLTFMASGPLPPNAADILGGTKIYSLVSVGAESFDLIVIDTPPLLGLADAQLIANSASATILVVGSGQSKKGAIRNAMGRLAMARVNVIGSLLTKFDAKSGGYGYGYGYSYSYGGDAYSYGGSKEDPSTALNPPKES